MSYQEPLSAFGTPKVHRTEHHAVILTDEAGTELSVRRLSGIGWEIELRYDRLEDGTRRQVFTGVQDHLPCAPLTPDAAQDRILLEADGERMTVTQNGAFTIDAADRELFRSIDRPFLRHATPVEIQEGIMSLSVTDLSERTPYFPRVPTYATRMTRFLYPRPEGTVLGLPGQAGEMNRNGYRFELYNTDEPVHTPNRNPLYQSWPILFHRTADGHGWTCVFHDNPSRTFVDIGDFYSDVVTFESIAGNTRVYVITAPTLEEASQRLALLLGGSALPPLWAFGYQQCRWSYMSTDDMRMVVDSFREHDLPLDCIYYDIDYMDGFRVFTNNAVTFGEMRTFLEQTKQRGIHSVCIIDPGVKIDPEYPVYERIMREGAYLKTRDGEPFKANVWAGESVLPDFGDPDVRALWADMQKQWLDLHPFDGVWNDMNEPANWNGRNAATAQAVTRRGSLADEWNLYGYHMAHAARDGLDHAAPGKRMLNITRAGYAGVQRHAVVWHGDNMAWWEHLRLALETAVQYSLCAAHYTGADVPGFTGNPPDDLAVRFYQLGAVLPFFRGHSIYFSRQKEPYAYGPEANVLIRDAIRLRYSLLREWYTAYEEAARTGRSPLLPLFDDRSRLCRDQFLLFFGRLLAAPVVTRDAGVKTLWLPPGTWYPLGRPKQPLHGGQWLTLAVELGSIPLFVRAGTILTRNTVRHNASATLAAEETQEIYPDEAGNADGSWYDDDGISRADPEARRFRLLWNAREKTVERHRSSSSPPDIAARDRYSP